MPSARLTIHLAELPAFARLVEFVEDVENYAKAVDDYSLGLLVDACREDLLAAAST